MENFTPPRYLTVAEIEDIVSIIPQVRAATKETAEKATSQIKAKFRIQLREYRVCPQKIPALKGTILCMYLRSRLEPGEPVGLTAGEGIGGPTTQMTLSGFHQTGSKNVGSGVDIIRELLNITSIRKVENSTIHFRDKNLTFEEVMERKRVLVGVTVFDLVKSTDIKPSIKNGFVLHEGHMVPSIVPVPYEERGLWYKAYYLISDKKFEESSYYLRLTIDRARMYAHKLTIGDIVNTLETEESGLVYCIPSPSSISYPRNTDSYIDVYLDNKQVISELKKKSNNTINIGAGINNHNAALFVIQLFIIPALKQFIVSGIPRIKQLYPQTIRTLSIVRNTQKYMRDIDIEEELARESKESVNFEKKKFDLENKWSMWIDPIRLRINGIPLSKLTTLLNLCDITIEYKPEDPDPDPLIEDTWVLPRHRPKRALRTNEPMRYVVIMKDEHGDVNGNIPSPQDYINNILNMDAEIEKKRISDIKIEHKRQYDEQTAGLLEVPKYTGIYVEPKVTPLGRAGNYVYADADGSNLKGLLTHRLIDKRRTICNNPGEIAAVLGIEAARNFIIRDFYETITNHNAYVSPRHISVIADFMTNQMLMSITSKGISRQNRGAFSDASFEHAIEAFVKSATFGKLEEVTATSTCIFMGNRCGFGTGIMKMSIDLQNLNDIKQTESKSLESDLDRLKSSIANITDMNLANMSLQFGDGIDSSSSLEIASDSTGLVPSAVSNTLITDFQDLSMQNQGLPVIKSVASKGPVPSVESGAMLNAPDWLLTQLE